MKAILPLLAGLALALSGCISTENIALTQVKEPSLIPAGYGLNQVALAPAFADYRDTVTVAGHLLWTFPSGEVAGKVFIGGPDADWHLDILSSQLTIQRNNDLLFVSTTAHYNLSCLLTRRDRKIPLSASSVGESITDQALAFRIAVERAMLDLSKQAAAVTAATVQAAAN